MGLARIATATCSRPCRVELQLPANIVAFDGYGTTHELPILGLPLGEVHNITMTARDSLGETASQTLAIDVIGEIPDRFPDMDVLVSTDAAQPGYLLLNARSPDDDGPGPTFFLDSDLQVIWWHEPNPKFGDLRMTDHGTLFGLGGKQAIELSMLGEPIRVVGSDLHHDAHPLPDGSFWSLAEASAEVDGYPVSYDQPLELRPARIRDLPLVRYDSEGSLEIEVFMSELLDTSRIGFTSLNNSPQGLDWCHGNGLAVDPTDGLPIVSLRHQNALVKIDPAGPEVVWILGDPAGWREPWSDKLLQPVGELDWFYHQHAPEMHSHGSLVVFDNHNDGYTPYGIRPEDPPISRAVAYQIDADAMTVRQMWEVSETSTGPLYASAVGDADLLPNGNVLLDFGFLGFENGVENEDAGRGDRSARLIEANPRTGELALDLRFTSDVTSEPGGWKMYRAEKVSSLYPPPGSRWSPVD